MANLITQKEFDKVKNEKFTVLAFKEGRRISTMDGYNALQVLKYIMQVNGRDVTVLVLPANTIKRGDHDRDLEYYKKTYEWDISCARDYIKTRY